MATTSVAGFSAPSVSLPKGGGAIRGIGETFATNPAKGTSSLTIPLPLSPGRAGYTPPLALTYDSGAGNGPYGLGWRIGLPAITRRTDRGLPRYLDTHESDIFVLSGAEELVPERTAGGSRYEELRDGFRIQRYRPRVEGLFARIERWTNQNNPADVFWRSISRSNITTVYGVSPRSRIADPRDPSRIFSWLACESFDDKGNAAVYDYVAEDERNVDVARTSEASRTAVDRSANRYLKRVRYGNRTSRLDSTELASADWMFELVLDFGDHDDTEPTSDPARAWPARPDPFSTYRAGFELRTYRRCRRVLMFHRFEELSAGPRLVRALELGYDDLIEPSAAPERELAHQGSTRLGSLLRRVTLIGYGDGGVARAMPPLELAYSRPMIDPELRTLDPNSVADLRGGVDGVTHQWLDLNGEGIAGVFTEQAGAWWYKQNLGDGALAPAWPLGRRPAIEGRAQLVDLAGDGRLDAVTLRAPRAGFYERDDHVGWSRFKAFSNQPNVAWDDPDLRLVDLTGDGHADLVIAQGGQIAWHASLQERGFGEQQRVAMSTDEDVGPLPVFRDPHTLVAFADMSGDGLSDLVRIRNGEVCYWPNLGYGRFGAKIVMDGGPVFDAPDQFDPNRIRLADIDGSGVTDIIYLGRDAVQLYFNRAGNGLTAAHQLTGCPRSDNAATVTVTDLLGTCTACLVWSTPLPGQIDAPIHFVDLMGGEKPHLLVRIENNLGARTELAYTTSTKFYLADRRAGRPWATRLPFPVHVVERTVTFDEVGRNRFVRRFAYHDGYFDGHEREFRGFGEVEQYDAELLSALGDAANVDAASHVPPVLTRTRFLTGAERGDAMLPAGLSGDEQREAIRALAGAMVRQEVFALDGSERELHPYSIAEQRFEVRLVQPRGPNRHAVFFTYPLESITSHTERRPEDPRIVHTAALEVDAFGNVLLSASVAYGRSRVDPSLAPADQARQQATHITFAQIAVTNAIDSADDHRTPLGCESRSFELTGLATPAGRYTPAELRAAWRDAEEIAYEAAAATGVLQKRAIAHARTLYRKDDLSGPLPLGQIEPLALPYETYQLALTPGLAASVFAERIDEALLASDGRYVHSDGDTRWWIPSGRVFYTLVDTPTDELAAARADFFVPRRHVDPWGHATKVTYDRYRLLVREIEDARGNRTVATNDYRVLAPRMITDPNGNRSEVLFDALGHVVATAVMGKTDEGEGDSLEGVVADLPDEAVLAHLADPLKEPYAILGRATTRLVYDLSAYQRSRGDTQPAPAVVSSLVRQTHDADLEPGEQTVIQHALAYSDGFGRTIQNKALAEPGPDGSVRWIASGWTVFDNKGHPVRTFEPFFTDSHRYESDVRAGVSSIAFYDPVGRLVGTMYPDHRWAKFVFDAWHHETWDVNDTTLLDPAADPDVGAFVRRLPDDEYLPTWHARRVAGTAEERAAADKAAAHAATPAIAHLDALARVFLGVANTGTELLVTRTLFDIEGNVRAVIDALDRVCVRYDYDLNGRLIHQASMEAGERWGLPDIAGKPIAAWDSRGHELRMRYDELQRPVETRLGTIVVGRTVYGEHTADPELHNLRGRAVQQFDQAGVVTTDRYDFKGNLVRGQRQLARDYKGLRDWSAQVALEPDVFTHTTAFDALNRPVALAAPDVGVRSV